MAGQEAMLALKEPQILPQAAQQACRTAIMPPDIPLTAIEHAAEP
jgi:hypothetical protein